MLPGPIFHRERKAAARPRDMFVLRVFLAVTSGAVAIAPGLTLALGFGRDDGVYQAETLRNYGLGVFAAIVGVEIVVLLFVVPATVATSITDEREKDTLALLLLTRLTRLELVATKLAGRLMPPFLSMLTALPLILGCVWCAGLPAPIVVEIFVVSATTLAVAGSLAILASARHERSSSARGEAMAWTTLWLVSPMLALVPVPSGTLLGDLLVVLLRLGRWIAPSSPVSFLTISSWFSAGGPGVLSDRLITMLVMHVAMIALALAGAVASLRLREPHPHSLDAHQGYRPPVGDDPIFWREYILPWRGARMPLVVILARRIAILVRAIAGLVLQVVFLMLAMAVPIGLLIAVVWFGFLAFQELWIHRSFATGPYDARNRFNVCIRIVTWGFGVMPLVAIPAAIAGRFTIERDKKTWEPLLATPLSGAEILTAKMQVSIRGLSSIAWLLIALWLLGIACGALHPLGAIIAAVEMPLAAWLGLALGTWLGIRPDSTTRAASSAASLWSLGLVLMGALVIVGPLCSVRELAAIWRWDARVTCLAVVLLMTVPPMTWAFARSLTRRCFDHFDEWVGRPHRACDTENALANTLTSPQAHSTQSTVS